MPRARTLRIGLVSGARDSRRATARIATCVVAALIGTEAAAVAVVAAGGNVRAIALRRPIDAADVQVERRVAAMGTELAVSVWAPTRAHGLSASEAAIAAVEAVEQRLSEWRPDSELSRLNRAEVGRSVELSAEFVDDLHRPRHWWSETDGAFHPAALSLIRCWQEDAPPSPPSGWGATRARELGFVFRDRSAVRTHQDAALGSGGFGKGVALDRAVVAVRAAGISRSTFDFGGQVVMDSADDVDARWTLDVADPDVRARPVVRVSIGQGSWATSGNSEHARVVDGRRVGHLLDPRSGAPAADFGSISVWCRLAVDADCLSTGLFVLGSDRALEFARERDGVEVLVLERRPDGIRVRASAGLLEHLEVVADDCRIAREVTATAGDSSSADRTSRVSRFVDSDG